MKLLNPEKYSMEENLPPKKTYWRVKSVDSKCEIIIKETGVAADYVFTTSINHLHTLYTYNNATTTKSFVVKSWDLVHKHANVKTPTGRSKMRVFRSLSDFRISLKVFFLSYLGRFFLWYIFCAPSGRGTIFNEKTIF